MIKVNTQPVLTISHSTFCTQNVFCVSCMELRTNSSYIPVQHKLTDFYSQECGQTWIFKYNSEES